ncbi:MAG TPA: HAMP domain-containing sensor histidine kinase [Mycobacteriales bacterium]|nr:HAMP domain-containing sensor histidine kinase [Mycobacteriales bacterium]
MRRLSLRGRLTLLVAVAVAMAVAGASVGAWFAVRRELLKQIDQTLTDRPPTTEGLSTIEPESAVVSRQPSTVRFRVMVINATGTVVGTDDIPVRPQAVAVAKGASDLALYNDTTSDGVHVRVSAVPWNGGALVRARPLTETDTTLSHLTWLLLLVSGLGVVGAGCLGLVVSRAGLKPVDRLTATAEEIARTEQLVAVDVRGTDEIARLGRAFNTMTSALDRSRRQQKQLVLDAGHELRTPLTSLRTNIDLLVRADRAGRALPATDRERLLDDLTAQTDELGSLVSELVELTREQEAEPPEPTDLGRLVQRAVERARLRAPHVRFDVSVEEHVVAGNAAALERAVLNLLDNAVKFGPPRQTVRVRLHAGVLTVDDEGPGIADEDVPHVFERFYRAASSRAMPGSGLGLAIVAQAVRAHDGTVTATASPGGGTRVTVELPGSASPV